MHGDKMAEEEAGGEYLHSMVSFASILGLFCLCNRSRLPKKRQPIESICIQWKELVYTRSLLPLY
jgi:hypothetical protein